jgi:hypothetical protein
MSAMFIFAAILYSLATRRSKVSTSARRCGLGSGLLAAEEDHRLVVALGLVAAVVADRGV